MLHFNFHRSILMLLFLGMMGCAAQHEKTQEDPGMETVYGTAKNTSDGAVIENKSGIFLVEGLVVWEDSLLSKRLKATGIIEYIPAKDGKGYNGHSSKMRVLKNVSFERVDN